MSDKEETQTDETPAITEGTEAHIEDATYAQDLKVAVGALDANKEATSESTESSPAVAEASTDVSQTDAAPVKKAPARKYAGRKAKRSSELPKEDNKSLLVAPAPLVPKKAVDVKALAVESKAEGAAPRDDAGKSKGEEMTQTTEASTKSGDEKAASRPSTSNTTKADPKRQSTDKSQKGSRPPSSHVNGVAAESHLGTGDAQDDEQAQASQFNESANGDSIVKTFEGATKQLDKEVPPMPDNLVEEQDALSEEQAFTGSHQAVDVSRPGISPLQVLSPVPFESPPASAAPSIAESTRTETSGTTSAPPAMPPRKPSSDSQKGWKGWLRSASSSAPSFSRRSTTLTTQSVVSEVSRESGDLLTRFERAREANAVPADELSPIDWDFWATVMASSTPREVEGLRQRIRGGIPDEIRGIVWQAMTGSKDEGLEQLYHELSDKPSSFDKQIKKDTMRMSRSLLKSLEV